MADDVTSFFKSKKSKKHGPSGHSAIVQTPDALARRLERTVQQQQQFDRENGAEEIDEESEQQRPPYTQQVSGSGAVAGGGGEQNKEESEWLDYQEQTEVDVAKFGIKEMEIREESDDEANEDEESLANRKTWNIPGQHPDKVDPKAKKVTYAAGMDVDDGEEHVNADDKSAPTTKTDEAEKHEEEHADESKAEKEEAGEPKQKYVPPSLRRNQLSAAARPSWMKQPNIEDSAEFPSLAAAGELEAEIEKTKKKKPSTQQAYSFAKKAASSAPGHAASPTPADHSHSPRAPEAAHAAAEPPKSTYVPPHLRKRGGAS